MGLFDKLKSEFIDIIEWQDSTSDTIVYRFPRYQNEIKMGAQLTVRESQVAVFMNEGTIADVFLPGMYTLQTQNMPLLSTLKGWKYGFNSPFKADIYFVSTRQFTDQKWGTKSPVILDDSRFGMIELRAFGTYTFKISDAGHFIKEIAGTDTHFSTEEIASQLRSLIVTKFSDALAEGNIPVEKIAANLEELSAIAQERLNSDFAAYGLSIIRFLVENISMPEELKKEIFEYSRLSKIDMQKLSQFKAAKAIEKAAENSSGTASAGVGMGVGLGVGQMMGQMFTHPLNPNSTSAPANVTPPPLPPAQYFVALNHEQQGPFTLEHLSVLVAQGKIDGDTLLWKNGMAQWGKAKEVSEIQHFFKQNPPPLPQ